MGDTKISGTFPMPSRAFYWDVGRCINKQQHYYINSIIKVCVPRMLKGLEAHLIQGCQGMVQRKVFLANFEA